jgi:dTMP kinase
MLKIEFEGTDGAGKTTGLKYFIEEAKKLGLDVVETREVGNPSIPACVKLREFVLDPNSNLTGEAMELLFSAMRFENDRWTTDLVNSGNEPDFLVSDRGWFSHLAYTDHNVSPEFTKVLYKGVMEERTFAPDVVIYFQVSTETALKRRVKRGTGMDVIEMKGIEFQNQVRDSFEKYMKQSEASGLGPQIFVIDANQSIEEVQSDLDEILSVLTAPDFL